MKKRYSTIATAISAAFILAACTQTDVVDDMASMQAENPANNAISFSTYSAKKGTTRAGYSGSMTNDALKGKKNKAGEDPNFTYSVTPGKGFGVFAYYTGEAKKSESSVDPEDGTYGVYRGNGKNDDTNTTGAGSANFMYNQKVENKYVTEDDASTDTYWTYSPLKYWPNDFSEEGVDMQNPAAQGSGKKGNVSFFAYAPYVETIPASEEWGIVDMTKNDEPGDPRIKYVLQPDAATGKYVDLLWGTLDASKTGGNAAGKPNTGVKASTDADATEYQKEILAGNTVAADLTKQKVNGQVAFAFKHALAGIGGSTETVDPEYDPDDDDDDEKNIKSGFLVKLDIDKSEKGETTSDITGGSRQQFKILNEKAKNVEDLSEEEAEQAGEETYYRTIVTIKSVKITNATGDVTVKVPGEGGTGTETETKTATSKIFVEGTLNLATGEWENKEETTTTSGGSTGTGFTYDQTIGDSEDATSNKYKLNPAIAENKADGKYFNSSQILDYFKEGNTLVNEEKEHTGVIEEALNVYESTAVSPIILIPESEPIFNVNVVYVVRQYDDALGKKYTEIENNISKNVIFPKVKLNTHYTLVMHIGLTSVKFTAKVDKWSEYGGSDDDDTDPDPDGEDKRTDGIPVDSNFGDIELPSNEADQ